MAVVFDSVALDAMTAAIVTAKAFVE